MAKLKILMQPDEVLRKRSKEVTEFGSRLWQLLDDLRPICKFDPAKPSDYRNSALLKDILLKKGILLKVDYSS